MVERLKTRSGAQPLLWLCLALATFPSAIKVAAQQPPREPPPRSRAAVLFGRVLDEATTTPLDLATISIAGAAVELAADARGRFLISLPGRSRLTITVTRLGYTPLTQLIDVPDADTARVDFFLVRIPPTLDTVRVNGDAPALNVSARLAGFEQRRRHGGDGTFITRDQIERQGSISTLELLRLVPGVKIVDSAGIQLIASSRSDNLSIRRNAAALRPCVMSIGVDGQIREWGFGVDEIVPKEIYGIEVYAGLATIPREFIGVRADAACGLVMIWTRGNDRD